MGVGGEGVVVGLSYGKFQIFFLLGSKFKSQIARTVANALGKRS